MAESSSAVVEVTTESFEKEVIARSHEVPVVVDFWAPWCGPCRVLGPILEKAAEQDEGRWILAKVDTDQNPQLSRAFKISGIPAVKALVGGKVVSEFTGALPPAQLRRWLDSFLPSPLDGLLKEARAAEASGETDAARRAYAAVLREDIGHAGALLGSARLSLEAGDPDAARKLVDSIPIERREGFAAEIAAVELLLEAGGESAGIEALQARLASDGSDLDARYELAVAQVSAERYEEALANLLEIVKRDRSFRDDIGRKTMVKVFEILGVHSELASKWRRRLGSAMY